MRFGIQSGVFVSVRDALTGGGGALLSATSDQIGLQILGLLAIVFGFGHIIWGVTVDGEQWWKRKAPSQQPDTNWIPLHKALRYIALRSKWAFSANAAPVRELDNLLEGEVKERLAIGEIRARGREVRNFSDRWSATTVPIPNDFWETAFFQAFGEIVICDDWRGAASRNGSYVHVPARSFREVKLDFTKVKQIWPEVEKARRLEENIFHHALIEYFTGEKKSDQAFMRELKLLVSSDAEFQ